MFKFKIFSYGMLRMNWIARIDGTVDGWGFLGFLLHAQFLLQFVTVLKGIKFINKLRAMLVI